MVSISTREDKGTNLSLVTFKWEPLEEYLVASKLSLVRMFDITLFRKSGFNGWSNKSPQEYYDSDHFFYHQLVVPNNSSYTRGIQIIRPRRSKDAVFADLGYGWNGEKSREYAEFIAQDWRNERVVKISTDPNAAANYFNSQGNSLPFELSPAFFKPEVLLKYKADRDKYTVSERSISCRAAWYIIGT